MKAINIKLLFLFPIHWFKPFKHCLPWTLMVCLFVSDRNRRGLRLEVSQWVIACLACENCRGSLWMNEYMDEWTTVTSVVNQGCFHQSSQNSFKARHTKGHETWRKTFFLAGVLCVCMQYLGSYSMVEGKQPYFLSSWDLRSEQNLDLARTCPMTRIWSLCDKWSQQANILHCWK